MIQCGYDRLLYRLDSGLENLVYIFVIHYLYVYDVLFAIMGENISRTEGEHHVSASVSHV